MLLQGSRHSVSQLSEETEAALPRLDALLLQLSVESLHYHRHLDTRTRTHTHTHTHTHTQY